jgi:hypothetical protein
MLVSFPLYVILAVHSYPPPGRGSELEEDGVRYVE